MCGIAGCLSFREAVQPTMLKVMTDVIAHRGPDGDGQWINPGRRAGLGHRRLSIIDLSDKAAQPMHYLNRYTITYNGEIYNYRELKEILLKDGYVFETSSDTEVLLALYDKKKEKCLNDMDGMFSFAIWDEKEQKLFCARDRFGEKPFYYFMDDSKFFFGSEMKQLFAAGIPKRRDDHALFRFLANPMILSDRNDPSVTFFRMIHKLERSHFMVVTLDGKLVKKRYWDINKNAKSSLNLEEAKEEFYRLLCLSVSRRLRSDVTVGSSLSGGLDSSTIVTIIDQIRKGSGQSTFSARFRDHDKDEGAFIKVMTESIQASPYECYPDAEGLATEFSRVSYHQEEPFSSASIYAQWSVMKLAKEKAVTVLLDGQGADETLAGYRWYREIFQREQKGNSFTKMLKDVKSRVLPSRVSALNDISGLLTSEFKQEFGAECFFEDHQTLTDKLYYDTMTEGLEDLLRYADRNSMAHSREVRLPFLFHELVEFIFTLPSAFKLHGSWSKYILRIAFEKLLPPGIAWRKDKIGYEPPQDAWLAIPAMRENIQEAKNKLTAEKILKKGATLSTSVEWSVLVSNSTLFT